MPILTLKWLSWERPLTDQTGQINSLTKYLPYGENFIKIRPVDPGIIGLPGIIKK